MQQDQSIKERDDFTPSQVDLGSMFVGTFDRYEAENTASVAEDGFRGDELFSEDLY